MNSFMLSDRIFSCVNSDLSQSEVIYWSNITAYLIKKTTA